MQFKVPQNVQREDTIVGPLTLKQLIMSGVGGGITYGVYTALSNTYTWPVWIGPKLIGASITILFAFVKVHELTFTQYLLSGVAYLFLPRKRVWVKGSGNVGASVEQPKPAAKEKTDNTKIERQQETIKNLDRLTEILDNQGMTKNPNT